MYDFTVITLTYGLRHNALIQCIESVMRTTKQYDVKFIIVDNASGDITRATLGRYACLPNFEWIKLDKNEGVSARNYGIQKAEGDFFAIIDDDCVVTNPNWFNDMKSYMTEEVWAVGNAGANYSPDGELGYFGPQNVGVGEYCDYITGYMVLYKNIRNADGTAKYLMHTGYKSLRDESDFTNQAKIDGLRLRVCPMFCTHNSLRKWNPDFDSIDGDNKIFKDRWDNKKDLIKWESLR